VKILPVFVCLCHLPAFAEDSRVTTLLMRGDAQERQHHTRAALAAFRAAEQLEPDNVGVLLRMSKQYSDLITQAGSGADARNFAERARQYAARAVELAPDNAKAHLSLAICYGKLTEFVGSRTKVEYSKIVHDETLRSIEFDPHDDFAWHVLGRWHYEVANISSMLKTVAKLIYGGLPAASNEEAIKHLKKASEIAPQRIIHHSELARVYRTVGRMDLAIKEWQAVAVLPATDHDEEKEKSEAETALNRASRQQPSHAGP
jgi:tetratricopeptide (TPR) repeat protein